MITNLVMTRLRHLLVTVAALLKRILCCCSRRRKASTSESGGGGDAMLSSVDVVRDSAASRYKNVVEKDWNSWDDSPSTVEEHIERYREQLVAPPPPKEPPPEEQMDFFQDMAPKTFSQQMVCIAEDGPGDGGAQFSRLTAQIDIPVEDGLTDWNDDGPRAGWDDADENTTKQLIRETRKELRQQRQQQHHQSRGYYNK
ncbi:uncharacterized protein LOC135713293 [Ochlerotatus camptorhynchus]|uniref:uncharacterized protein LOC135713293 n=1 Tax=Ochlerotatus camptorhynchus TaxID=644619 RepID=UPI0031D64DC7